jgi:hypothetical protein
VRSRGDATSTKIRFLVRPLIAQGHGCAADRKPSAEKGGDQGKPVSLVT